MPKRMSISVNGDSRVPPGFRFHPTEEELLEYYLRKKVGNETIDLDVICEVDLNKSEPWEIQEKCKIRSSTPQKEWYFFSHKDKKYPTGTRANRATTAGFWKATGRDKMIYSSVNVGQRIGLRKTLVFYKGRAPHGRKSDWIMYEYRLVHHEQLHHDYNHHRTVNDVEMITTVQVSNKASGGEMEDGWVVCKIFKKKNHHMKAADLDNKKNLTSLTDTVSNNSNQSRDQYNLLQYHPSSPACNDEDALEYILRDFQKTLEAQTQTATSMNNKYRLIESPNSTAQLPYNYNYLQHHDQYNQLPSPPLINCCQLLTSVTENQFPGFPTQQQLLISSYDGDVNNLVQVTAAAVAAAAVDTTTAKIAGTSSFGPVDDWAAFDMRAASQLNGPTMSFCQNTCQDNGRPCNQDY